MSRDLASNEGLAPNLDWANPWPTGRVLEQPLWDASWPLSDIWVPAYQPLHNACTLRTNTGTLSDKLIVAPPFLRHFGKNSFKPFLRPLLLRPEIANPKSFHSTYQEPDPSDITLKRNLSYRHSGRNCSLFPWGINNPGNGNKIFNYNSGGKNNTTSTISC